LGLLIVLTSFSQGYAADADETAADENGAGARSDGGEAKDKVTKWTPSVMMQVNRVGNVRVSPDGKRVVYTQTRAVMTDEKSRYITQIFMADSDGKEQRPFTLDAYSSRNPKWSPDGKWLAFTSGRAGWTNLYVIRTDGGEARPLTKAKSALRDFIWSPASDRIAFLMVNEPTDEDKKKSKARDDQVTVDEDYRYQHIWLVGLPAEGEEPEPKQLTKGEFNVSLSYASGLDWSPDGSSIVFSHTPTPKLNDWTKSDISMVDIESGEVTALATSNASEYAPLYSKSGDQIAFVKTDDPPSWTQRTRLALMPADGGESVLLAENFNSDLSPIGWASSGKSILAFEFYKTSSRILSIPSNGKEAKVLAEPKAYVTAVSLNETGTRFGLIVMDTDRAAEAHVSRVNRFNPVQVSRANADIPDVPLGNTRVISWASTDGLQIEGLLTLPVGYQEGEKYPLLLIIHGGPASHYARIYIGASSLYPVAAFAAEGYAVLRANPRGSGAYGFEFRSLNKADWGGMDYIDLMAGVDHLIELGIADGDRLGVMGWSYGGFLTSWTITQTDRFKAASIGAPVTSLMGMNGTSDIPDFVADYFGGEFWEMDELYRARSPLFQISKAKTPSLIQHGQADRRVPISQGIELYRAMKRLGVEVKMVIYPRSPHGPAEPRQVLRVMEGNVEWFGAHVPSNQ
jgi:dipeptidyl aminopeptidase/acylaminoacyl peptidase|tara:strand:- start:25372 stop:27423 length:2052 start_codon:yes stop_codon:yes gene_type:complete